MKQLGPIIFIAVTISMPLSARIITIELLTASQDADSSTFQGRSFLEAESYIDLRNETGRPATILYIAPEGKLAKKGTMLVELDASTLVNQLEQQRIQVAKAKAQTAMAELSLESAKRLANAVMEVAKQGLVVAEGALKIFLAEQGEFQLNLKTVERTITVAEKRLVLMTERIKKLKDNSGDETVRNQLLEAELMLLEVKVQLEEALTKQRFLKGPYRDQKTAELKLGIAQSRLELIQAENELINTARYGEEAIAAAQANLLVEKSKLDRLEKQITSCKLYAPEAGVVIYPRIQHRRSDETPRDQAAGVTIKHGSIVRDGQIIIRMVNMKRCKLDVRVPLKRAQQIVPGQKAKIHFDALPQRVFNGRVTRVRVLTESRRQPVEGMITVRVEDPTLELKIGLTASVEFKISK